MYSVDTIMAMRKEFTGEKRIKLPVASAEEFIPPLHSQGGYAQFEEMAKYDSESDEEKRLNVLKLQAPLMAYKPVERRKGGKYKLRREGVKSMNANIQSLRVLLNKLSAMNFPKVAREIATDFDYSFELV